MLAAQRHRPRREPRLSDRDPHPELPRNLALIGGRGCGKSSVAKRLARRNRNFMLFSLDALIRYERGGVTIPQIVEKEGWAAFRELEYEVVRKATAFEGGALVDCGGGVVVDVEAEGREIYSQRKVDALKRTSLVVYLTRDFEYLRSRVEGDANRPALSQNEDFISIMQRRDPWYRRAADKVIDCDGQTKPQVADAVLRWYYQQIGADYTPEAD
jgi:shikimate kinase